MLYYKRTSELLSLHRLSLKQGMGNRGIGKLESGDPEIRELEKIPHAYVLFNVIHDGNIGSIYLS